MRPDEAQSLHETLPLKLCFSFILLLIEDRMTTIAWGASTEGRMEN